MIDIEKRINDLEKQTGSTGEKPWLIVVYDDTGKPSEAVLEKAKADYKAKHPDWQERDYNVIVVKDEESKEQTKCILADERTEQ